MKRLFKPDGRFFFIGTMSERLTNADSRLERINELVDGVLAGNDLYRVETRIKGSAGQPMVDVFIDGDKGVTVEECASVSRRLYAAIEVDDLFDKSFRLDVSSPGLGKPLRLPRQYQRHLGRNLQVVLKGRESEDRGALSGKLVAAEPAGITLATGEDKLTLRFEEIERAVVTPSF